MPSSDPSAAGLRLLRDSAEADGGRGLVDEVSPSTRSQLGDLRILIVDDDPKMVMLLEVLLRKAGYCPVAAGNAETSLWVAQINPPAVIIVDLLMPGLDGFGFIEQLRATPAGSQVPIIVWTAKDLDADERRRLRSSTVAIISKRSGGLHTLLDELRRLAPAMLAALAVRVELTKTAQPARESPTDG